METMTKQQVADALEAHNEWRRDEEIKEMPLTPAELGKVIELAIKYLREDENTYIFKKI